MLPITAFQSTFNINSKYLSFTSNIIFRRIIQSEEQQWWIWWNASITIIVCV